MSGSTLARLNKAVVEFTTGRHDPEARAPQERPAQCYRAKKQGFKWHLDGGLYSAILTLVNTNEGATEVLSPEWSRLLFPVPYLLFPFARLLEFAKPKPLIGAAGDLLVIKGGEVLHR